MAMFAYVARDEQGRRVTGELSCASEQAALSELQARALAPIRVKAARRASLGRSRISTARLAVAYRQLADLLRAGVPLLRALRLLARRRASPALSLVMGQVADAVADGSTLADAMSRHPTVFPDIHTAMVRAAERGGFLEAVLARLARFLEHMAELRSKVLGNLIYPVVLLVVGVLVVVASMVFFVPKFRDFFATMELPWPTRLLFGISDVLANHWLLLIVLMMAIGAGAAWLWKQRGVQRRWAQMQMRLPVVGPLICSLAVGRFVRMLGTLLENGISLLPAMQISRDAAGHAVLRDAIDEAAEAVRGGDSLTRPLGASGLFDEDVLEMIAVGETANNLPEVLLTIADTIEKRIDRMLSTVVRLMEPALLLMLAAMIFFIFIALVVPMMRLSSAM